MPDIAKPRMERLLVCVSSSPSSDRLIGAAKEMATSLNAQWSAVYVEEPKALILPEAKRDRAMEHLRLAEQWGAATFTLKGRNIAEAIISLAREQRITRIITGKPKHSRWPRIFSGSPVDQLLRISGEMDIHVITGEPTKPREASYHTPAQGIHWPDYGTGLLFFILTNVLCFLMYPHFDLSNLIMLYLLGVMVTAIECGRGPAVLTSLLSVLAFDFLFVPPRFSFTVDEVQYVVTFLVMFAVSLVISHLTTRMQRQADLARIQERQAAAMHGLSRQLASTRGIEKILHVAVRYIGEIFDCQIVALIPDAKDGMNVAAGDLPSVLQKDITKELAVAQSAYDTGEPTGWGTKASATVEILYVPLRAAHASLGVLALRPRDPQRFLLPEQVRLLQSLAKQVTLALEVEYLTRIGNLPGPE